MKRTGCTNRAGVTIITAPAAAGKWPRTALTNERRALIKFNIDDVPSNATIVSADLRLYTYTTWGTANSFTAEAHKMLVAWDEGTGSAWNNNLTTGSDWQYADQPGSSWGADGMLSGTDYSATVISTTEMNSTDTNKWKTVDIKSAVEDWLATPSSNYGVALITESADINDYIGIGFRSSDYSTDASLRPKLVVTYTFGDLAEYNYTPSGAINSVTFNSGDSTYSGVFAYQERDWVTDITYKSESDVTLFDIDYIHDDAGNIDSLSYTNLSETDNVGYDYDNLNRLTKATSNTHNELIWTYDKNGNIKTKQVTDTQTNYAYTYDTANGRPNRLTDFDGAAYGYDANGNVGSLDDDNILLQRDYKNQIEWYEGNKDEFYDYDAAGRRVYKQAIEDTTYIENFDDGDFDDGLPTDWYTSGANWQVSTGELLRNSTSTSLHQFSNPDITYDDFTVEYDLKADAYSSIYNWAAFAFRKTNYTDVYTDSGYMVYYRQNGEILLYEYGGGNLASSSTGLDLSTWRHVKIVVSGSSIKVYVDGTLRINHTDGTYTDGYFGFFVAGLKARFDDLEIRDEAKVHYVRDANGDVLAEYNDGGDLLVEYVYANGQRIAKLTSSGSADIYLNDHLGSARVMARSGWSANYYPFGEVASQTGSNVDTRFDFTGQERDEGTGLMYFGARYYDPVIGRWLSPDPLAEKYPRWSPYNYTLDNPVRLIDIDGRDVGIKKNGKFVPISVDEATTGTLGVIKQMMENKGGKFNMEFVTTQSPLRDEFEQVFSGKRFDFTSKSGTEFMVNSQFTLTGFQKSSGSTTVGGFFDAEPDVRKGQEGKIRVKFSGFGKDSGGRTFLKEKPVIMLGTLEKVNADLKTIGLEIFKTDGGIDIRNLPKEEEEDEKE